MAGSKGSYIRHMAAGTVGGGALPASLQNADGRVVMFRYDVAASDEAAGMLAAQHFGTLIHAGTLLCVA